MSKIRDTFSKNAVRISFLLVILFAGIMVAMTAKFVLVYSSEQNITPSDSSTTTTLDKVMFDNVTKGLTEKTTPSEEIADDIRDPFSPKYEPPPPPPEPDLSTEAPTPEI